MSSQRRLVTSHLPQAADGKMYVTAWSRDPGEHGANPPESRYYFVEK